jgi:hypothetical protein
VAVTPVDEVSPAAGEDSTGLGDEPESSEETAGQPETSSLALQTRQSRRSLQAGMAGRVPNDSLDTDSLTDLVTSTIRPTSWDDVGGPGSFAFFAPSLAFVVSTTDDIHEQIETLFERLRAIPPPGGSAAGAGLATKPPLQSDNPNEADFDSLIDLITSTVMPTSWDDVGGPGSIAPEPSRVALIFSQTREIHDEVYRLLTMLRRHRYELLRGERPWEPDTNACRCPLLEPSAAEAGGVTPLSGLPEPAAAALALLDKVRREPAEGLWLASDASGGRADARRLLYNGPRTQWQLGDRILRAEGDQAAIADRGLDLVELGDWGETLRQLADAQFPWLPHRSNRDLARLFRVEPLDTLSGPSQGSQGNTVGVRLAPRGLPPDSGAWLELRFSKSDGLTDSCNLYWQGKRTGRVRFPKSDKDAPSSRVAVVEDAQGKPLARWASEIGPPHRAIPPLDQSWDDYDVWDRRVHHPAYGPFSLAIDALRKLDWRKAASQLEEVRKLHPHRPLPLLLYGWCYEHDRSLGREPEMLAMLGDVASGGRPGLVEFIGDNYLTSLSRQQRYEILKFQPAASRTAANLGRLAQTAVDLGRMEDALGYASAALALPGDDGRRFDRWRIKVECLLRLDRSKEARAAVEAWQAEARQSLDQMAGMARLLRNYGKMRLASEVLTQALAAAELGPAARHDLLIARSGVREGIERWGDLLQAAALLPAASPDREETVQTLLAELTQPSQEEAAAQLAAATQDADLKRQLLLKEADLTLDPALCGDVGWRLFEAGQLVGQDFGWICSSWNVTGRTDRTIRFCEDRLRAGRELHSGEAAELEKAYDVAGRLDDAHRARTSDPVPQRQPSASVPAPATGGFM